MAKRRGIGKKKRFEVFKRDGFMCQYCGASAPDVLLELDHIKPVSKGGNNDMVNLITSCFDCNRGKGARELSDNSVAKKSIDEIRRQKEKLEQAKMIVNWKEEKLKASEYEMEKICEVLEGVEPGFFVTKFGQRKIRATLKRFTLAEVYDSAVICVGQYNDLNRALEMIGGICYNRRKKLEEQL